MATAVTVNAGDICKKRRGGSTGAALAPIGSQFLAFGDGVMSEGAVPGQRNGPTLFYYRMNGRIITSPSWMQCKSGGNLDTIYARIAATNKQQADILLFASQGHNDGILGTDPDLDPSILNKWKRNLDNIIANNPNAKLIPVCNTLPSGVSNEVNASSFNASLTIRQRVHSLQSAYITEKNDSRIFLVDLSSFDYTTMTNDAGFVHPNGLGGTYIADILYNAISPKVVSASKDGVLTLIKNGNYPALAHTNLDADWALTGTSGTKSGITTPTGSVATGKRVTNNTSLSVVCSKDASAGTYERQVITASGAASVENTILFDDTTNITITGTDKGAHVACVFGAVVDDEAGGIPAGLVSFGATFGSVGSIGAISIPYTTAAGYAAEGLNACLIATTKASFGATQPILFNPAVGMRIDDGFSTTARMIIEQPGLYIISSPNQSRAAYIGDDTIVGSTYLIRGSGTISAASGGIFTIEPGQWCPYGWTPQAKRIYAGGTAGEAGRGTGTLVATIAAGSTYTYNIGAGTLAQGTLLYTEVDGVAGDGYVTTARSATAVTVGA